MNLKQGDLVCLYRRRNPGIAIILEHTKDIFDKANSRQEMLNFLEDWRSDKYNVVQRWDRFDDFLKNNDFDNEELDCFLRFNKLHYWNKTGIVTGKHYIYQNASLLEN